MLIYLYYTIYSSSRRKLLIFLLLAYSLRAKFNFSDYTITILIKICHPISTDFIKLLPIIAKLFLNVLGFSVRIIILKKFKRNFFFFSVKKNVLVRCTIEQRIILDSTFSPKINIVVQIYYLWRFISYT